MLDAMRRELMPVTAMSTGHSLSRRAAAAAAAAAAEVAAEDLGPVSTIWSSSGHVRGAVAARGVPAGKAQGREPCTSATATVTASAASIGVLPRDALGHPHSLSLTRQRSLCRVADVF